MKYFVLIIIGILFSGCTYITRQVSNEEAFYAINKIINNDNESTEIRNSIQVKWVQASNKKEQCKVYVAYDKSYDRTLEPDYKIYWDGKCKNGYAYGFGREIETSINLRIEALGLYSEAGKQPKYFYQINRLENEYISIDNDKTVTTQIHNETTKPFSIHNVYVRQNEKLAYIVKYSPLSNIIELHKIYNTGFGYFYAFDTQLKKIVIAGTTYQGEPVGYHIEYNINTGEFVHLNSKKPEKVTLPDKYLNHLLKIYDEILEETKNISEVEKKASRYKKQYISNICSKKNKINYIDNNIYYEICNDNIFFKEIDDKITEINEKNKQEAIEAQRYAEEMLLKEQELQLKRDAINSYNYNSNKRVNCFTIGNITNCY